MKPSVWLKAFKAHVLDMFSPRLANMESSNKECAKA